MICQVIVSPPRVIVVVTPGPNVHRVTLATDKQARVVQGQCGDDRVYTNPPANYSLFAAININIDWCQFQVSFKTLWSLITHRNVWVDDDTLFQCMDRKYFWHKYVILPICFSVIWSRWQSE